MKKIIQLILILPALLFAQAGRPEKLIRDSGITSSSGIVSWSKDTVYVIDGYVYVEEPSELHIEAGTVIKAKETPSTSDIASVLVITRGAKIFAEGTKEAPIIFTSEYDDTDLPDNGIDPGVDFVSDRGLWGGLVLLGKAVLNVAPEKVVEGLPANEPRALYGGSDDSDNSGLLKYVSIRYTGITVEANKELQGLTLGCVGSGTTIEYIESFNSSDDGFEFFGGTVNTKYLIAAFAEDDAFDYDQGFRGFHQFWFAIQGDSIGDHIGEYDGGDAGALTNAPLSYPVIYNSTFIGRGAGATGGDHALMYKEYGGGEHNNGIFIDFDRSGIRVDSGAGLTSYNRFMNDSIRIQNNIWWKGDGSDLSSIAEQSFVQSYLGNSINGNVIVDPQLNGITRNSSGVLDPRPALGGPAYTTPLKSYPSGNTFFDHVDYAGAFGEELWIDGWTALSQIGLVPASAGIADVSIPSEFKLEQNYPNPFNPSTKIKYSINNSDMTQHIILKVYDMLGKEITTLVNEERTPGNYEVNWNATGLSTGVYFYRLQAGSLVDAKKMILMK
jgi:hypothetical protein